MCPPGAGERHANMKQDTKPEEEQFVSRIREFIRTYPGYSEKRMFGGICFMIHGNMCVGNWKGSLVVRLDKKDHDAIQSEKHTSPFDVTGRVMKGWALVSPDGIRTDKQLNGWIARSAEFVASLPPK